MGLDAPRVLETHGGRGEIWKKLYSSFPGAVIEIDPDRAEFLSRQRPTWPVYEGDSEVYLTQGLFRWLAFDFVDIDPFGEPWPLIEGFFSSPGRQFAPRMAIVCNDGLRKSAAMKVAWQSTTLKGAVRKWGNENVRAHYLEYCEELMGAFAGLAGYKVEDFYGYYVPKHPDMTHYGAILVRG